MAGSALLTDSVAASQRAGVQGTADAVMGVAGMLGGAASGLVFGLAGYGALGVITVVLAAPVGVAALRRLRR